MVLSRTVLFHACIAVLAIRSVMWWHAVEANAFGATPLERLPFEQMPLKRISFQQIPLKCTVTTEAADIVVIVVNGGGCGERERLRNGGGG